MWKWGKDVNLPCRMHNFESQFQFVCTKKTGRSFFPEPDPFQYFHKFWRISPQNPISQMFFFPFSSSKSRHAWSYWIGREGVSKRGRCGQGVNKTHFGSWKKNNQWNLELKRKMNWYENLSSNLDSSHPDARGVLKQKLHILQVVEQWPQFWCVIQPEPDVKPSEKYGMHPFVLLPCSLNWQWLQVACQIVKIYILCFGSYRKENQFYPILVFGCPVVRNEEVNPLSYPCTA